MTSKNNLLHTPPIESKPVVEKDPLSVDFEQDDELDINLNDILPTNLNNKVNEFLKDLSKPKYSKPLSYSQIIDIFRQFYKDFEIMIKGSVNYNKVEMKEINNHHKVDENEIKWLRLMEIGEFRVTTALYDKLFIKNEKDVIIDQYIRDKISIIKKIKELDYKQLIDVYDVDLNLPILKTIGLKFKDLQNMKSPYEKISNLILIHSMLNNFLKEHLDSLVSGDYFLPLLIYLIISNDDQSINFYLNFTYIKNFRYRLNGNALYCLTNFEAALVFIQTLNLKENYEFSNQLTKEEEVLLNSNYDIIVPTTSFSLFDSSFKLLNRFKPEEDNLILNNPIKNFVGDVMKWTRTSTPSPPITSVVTTSATINNNLQLNLPDLNKFKDKKFQEMTINDLEKMFNDYQLITNQLRRS